MKNLKFYLTIVALVLTNIYLNAQDVSVKLNEAEKAYDGGNLETARFELQEVLLEIDRAIGAEILKELPESMGNIPVVIDVDDVTVGAMGVAGIVIIRKYNENEEKSASIQIIGDSPLLAGLNTMLSLPAFGNDPNQKRIRVNNYRALLQKSENNDGLVSWDIQIPVGNTLITFSCNGVAEESEVVKMANTIPVSKIDQLLK